MVASTPELAQEEDLEEIHLQEEDLAALAVLVAHKVLEVSKAAFKI
jgi:hypothetical protein